jgi:hypothetical protein
VAAAVACAVEQSRFPSSAHRNRDRVLAVRDSSSLLADLDSRAKDAPFVAGVVDSATVGKMV